MDLVVSGGSPLKSFTRALTCLTKFGEDIDLSIGRSELKLSSVNASRSAFGLVAFRSDFFARYSVQRRANGSRNLTLSVNGKALLSPLSPRSVNTIESCRITVTDGSAGSSSSDSDGGCRIIIRLHCLHGVIKTHKLTYSASSALYARASRAACTSSWLAPSRVLKDWTDHFHLKTSAGGGGMDEISFYHSETACVLKSFGAEVNKAVDYLGARPLGTELMVDVGDFERYDVDGQPLITINLKELKAIVVLADATDTSLDAAFTKGGSPFLVEVNADDFKADFVIATTDFDSGEPESSVKQERSDVGAPSGGGHRKQNGRASTQPRQTMLRPAAATSAAAAAPPGRPLFNAPSQQQHEDGSDGDEFGDDAGFDEEAFAEVDRVSQAYSQQQQASQQSADVPQQLRGGRHGGLFEPADPPLQEDEEPATEDDEGDLILGQSPRQTAVPPARKRIRRLSQDSD
ncbi:hypothetical protein ACM66B_003709 [Microbotryomycetes sp. NB124-2]